MTTMTIRCNLLPAAKRGKAPAGIEGFGGLRTDHMFVASYADGGWREAAIMPYGAFSLMPGATSLHYGQSVFEGAKAFGRADGGVYVFRFDENAKRLNNSARILMMPEVPVELQTEGLMRLLDVERAWCPSEPGSSLYIRPFLLGTEDVLGVRPAVTYLFCIMLSPSGAYYRGGFSRAVKLLATERFHRAAPGGTGAAKTGGNYAASLRAAALAQSVGADQVLYLDVTNTTIEEAGTMNHYHVTRDGVFVIPEFTDTILRSITSLSVLELARRGVVEARQETIPIRSFLDDVRSGRIVEAGGLGTAAVVSPVGAYRLDDGTEIPVGDGGVGPHSRKLYEYYARMQGGLVEAPEGWLVKTPVF